MGAARRDAVWVFTFCFSWVGFWGVCVFGLRVFGRRGSSEHRFVTGANLLGLRFGSAGGGGGGGVLRQHLAVEVFTGLHCLFRAYCRGLNKLPRLFWGFLYYL